jgi:hypothetical protein
MCEWRKGWGGKSEEVVKEGGGVLRQKGQADWVRKEGVSGRGRRWWVGREVACRNAAGIKRVRRWEGKDESRGRDMVERGRNG